MAETQIDLETWHRRETFKLFRSYQNPHYAVTTRLNVSNLVRTAKPRADILEGFPSMHCTMDRARSFLGARSRRVGVVRVSKMKPVCRGV